MADKMSVEQALAVVNAFRCGGYQQVCCGYPQGGGMDENGNGEPPECCGRPFDNDDLYQALATLRAELDGLRVDAERWQWFKRHCVRTCSLDVGGQHGYCVTEVFGRIAGPNINAAIDAARNQENDNG